MPDVPTATSALVALIGPAAGFAFGLVSATLLDVMARRREKQRLINLFQAELRRTHLEIDSRKQAPVGTPWARLRDGMLSLHGFHFGGAPEYEFEVYNTRLYETEGVRLAQQLRPAGRRNFWAAYGYLRDAEAARLVLKNLSADDRDREAYQKLFVGLIAKASDSLEKLWHSLDRERSWFQTMREALSKDN